MAQVFSRTQAATLIGSAIGEVWTSLEDAYKNNLYSKCLNKIEDDHARRISYQFAYFNAVPLKGEGASLEYNDMKTGTLQTVDPDTYGAGVRLTMEGIEAMRREGFGTGMSNAQLVAAARIAKAFREAAKQKKEVLAANLYLNAASTGAAAGRAGGAGYDGVALASASHPILTDTSVLGGTTFSNLAASSSLSQSALNTITTTFETTPTLEGLVRPLGMSYKLIVGPNLRHTAYTVVETTKQNKTVGTFDHDIPGTSDFTWDVVVNPYFGSSSTVYAVQGPDHQLGYWDYLPETFEEDGDFDTKGMKYSNHWMWVALHEGPYDFQKSAGA
jgi:hypothetical protein